MNKLTDNSNINILIIAADTCDYWRVVVTEGEDTEHYYSLLKSLI